MFSIFRNLIAFVCYVIMSASAYSSLIDYSTCSSLEEIIGKETREIEKLGLTDCEELSQIFTSRGESYLLDKQFQRALEDFCVSLKYLEECYNEDLIKGLSFRIFLGQVICYDNLGREKETNVALDSLQNMLNHMECSDCIENLPCQSEQVSEISYSAYVDEFAFCSDTNDKNNASSYGDILGPDVPPRLQWCEEIVIGTGRAMDAIACLAPNYAVKAALIGIIEAFVARGVKCCQAGGFWKACVAPIVRKWDEWVKNKDKHIFPNESNLPYYAE